MHFPHTAMAAAALINTTVYRTTPINYTGVLNMDTGDARGDVMFGLSQLLLPVVTSRNVAPRRCSSLSALRPAP